MARSIGRAWKDRGDAIFSLGRCEAVQAEIGKAGIVTSVDHSFTVAPFLAATPCRGDDPLSGKKIRLRALREADAPFFQQLRNDLKTQLALAADPRPQTPEQVRAWMEARSGSREHAFFVVAQRDSDEAAGFVELRGIQPTHGWASLGICIAGHARGQGLGGEALDLIETFGRDVLGLRKIVLQVLSSHLTAVQFYTRRQYQPVGTHRDHFYFGGRYHDVSIFEKHLTDRSVTAPPWTP